MQQLQQNYEPGKELEIPTNSLTVPENKVIEHESICNEQCENGPCLSGECIFFITLLKIFTENNTLYLLS